MTSFDMTIGIWMAETSSVSPGTKSHWTSCAVALLSALRISVMFVNSIGGISSIVTVPALALLSSMAMQLSVPVMQSVSPLSSE